MENDPKNGQRLLGAPFLKVQGDRGKIRINCWVLISAKSTSNVGICLRLNAHKTPMRNMGLRCDLILSQAGLKSSP